MRNNIQGFFNILEIAKQNKIKRIYMHRQVQFMVTVIFFR